MWDSARRASPVTPWGSKRWVIRLSRVAPARFAAVVMVRRLGLLAFAAFGRRHLSAVDKSFDHDAHEGRLKAVDGGLNVDAAGGCSLSDLIDGLLQNGRERNGGRCGGGGGGRQSGRALRQAFDHFSKGRKGARGAERGL